MTRTLPLRVRPAPGEALDSWVEALAFRHGVPLREICEHLSIPARELLRWLVWVPERECSRIAEATGVDPDGVLSCTLSTYDHKAVEINYDQGILDPSFPFTRRRGSRYCPLCLAESGGRWRLHWRLGWAFACLRHNCLLLDNCPRCGQRQRLTQSRWGVVPKSSRCLHWNPADPCGADLTDATAVPLTDTDQILRAQRVVFDIIETDRAAFGVYLDDPVCSRDALRDIKALALRALVYANRHGLSSITPPELPEKHVHARRHAGLRTPYKKYETPLRTIEAATAITAALEILRAPNVAAAGERAAWMVEPVSRRCHPAQLNTCAKESSVIAAILIKAYAPRRGPCTQLRYQSPLPFPEVPSGSQVWLQRLSERVPAVFWPGWAVRLTPPEAGSYTLPLALSCAVLLVGTTCSPSAASLLLGRATNGSTVGKHLLALQQLPQWNDVCFALVKVARYLAMHSAPIDYARRRRLDYQDLLTEDRWNEICRETGELAGTGVRRQIARLYLFEKISGLPARSAPFMADSKNSIGFWLRVFNFPAEASPQFAAILVDEGRRFLSSNGIDEPLVWHPPLTLLGDLALPGVDPERFGPEELHRALSQGQPARIGPIARRLNTSSALVHYLLEMEIDKASTIAAKYHVSPHPVRDRLCAELTPAILEDRYMRKGQSLSAIARSYGVRGPQVRQLAEMYGIPLRICPKPTSDWLHTEHDVNRRTCRDMAAEVGVAESTMLRWVRYARGQRQLAASTRHARMSMGRARAILGPDADTNLNQRRLRNFVRTLDYPTIAAAAKGLAMHEESLRTQIRAVERQYGGPLIQRARHGLAQCPTARGSQLAQAIRVAIGLD